MPRVHLKSRSFLVACILLSVAVHAGVLVFAKYFSLALPTPEVEMNPPMFEAELAYVIPVMLEPPAPVVIEPPPPPEPKILVPEEAPEPAVEEAVEMPEPMSEPEPLPEPAPEPEPVVVPEKPAPTPAPIPVPAPVKVAVEELPPVLEPLLVEEENLDAYWQSVRAEIGKKLRYPMSASRLREDATVQLRIEIEADGTLRSVASLNANANASLVRAAMTAVKRAAPFDAPKTQRAEVVAELPIVFRGR